ncbi:hypothetical protein BANRA_03792 [Acinetobacter baumannii]|nr:hypothetical protein BANRA_03792 [Acinetobacter baumannii]
MLVLPLMQRLSSKTVRNSAIGCWGNLRGAVIGGDGAAAGGALGGSAGAAYEEKKVSTKTSNYIKKKLLFH